MVFLSPFFFISYGILDNGGEKEFIVTCWLFHVLSFSLSLIFIFMFITQVCVKELVTIWKQV